MTDDGWKFIDHRGERPNELFHLPTDPLERRNVIAENSALAADLYHRLYDFYEPWRWKRSRHHKR